MGDQIEDCKLGSFQDASFAGDMRDSKSTSESLLCVLGSHTFVPMSWMCKKQTAVSRSSAESETISLDAGLGLDGLPALQCGQCMLRTLSSRSARWNLEQLCIWVHWTRSAQHFPTNSTQFNIFEDNAAVIQMINKGRGPNLRHITRTHRVDLD